MMCTLVQDNTFQLILATDWSYSFAIFNYPEGVITWQEKNLRARAGYNAGWSYLNFPGSGTENMTLLDEIEGNTGKIGQWVYRIDSTRSLGSEGEYLHLVLNNCDKQL